MSRLLALASLLALLAVAGCPDPLQDQQSIQAHERPLLSVPAGVVPTTHGVGVRNEATAEPAQDALEAATLTNPVKASRTNARLGKVAYGRYCSHCHGDLGYGWTSVGSSFDPHPPDLVQAIEPRSDGWLFGHVTFGGGLSPPLGPTVSVEDRWLIISYLRTLPEERASAPIEGPHWDQGILRPAREEER